ncbi:MAG TPA: hypothetical protein VJZ72_09285 [Candidatus Limnocylindrales bacterium]|nr:hypothetical protein [Candidatus Limnocylindrales bacterium]
MTVHAETAPSTGSATGPSRLLIGTTIALIVLAVAAVAVVLVGRPSGTASYPADSPEAAFQLYLTADEGTDPAAAYAAYSTRVRETWPYDEYLQARDMYAGWQRDGRRVWIDRADRDGDLASLYLTVEFTSGSGIGASTWTDHREVRMTLEDGAWRVDQRIVGLESY